MGLYLVAVKIGAGLYQRQGRWEPSGVIWDSEQVDLQSGLEWSLAENNGSFQSLAANLPHCAKKLENKALPNALCVKINKGASARFGGQTCKLVRSNSVEC